MTDVNAHIAKIDQQFMSTFAELNAAGIASLYTNNATLLPPNTEAVVGIKSIQEFWQHVFDSGIVKVTLKTIEIDEFGNSTVCQHGKYGLYGVGGEIIDEGKYLMIWKKIDNNWMIHKDMWNSDKPV